LKTLKKPQKNCGFFKPCAFMKKLFSCLIVLSFLLNPAFCSADENTLFTPAYAKRFWGDLKELPSKPLHWSSGQWLTAGAVMAGSLGALSFDSGIRGHFMRHRSHFFTQTSNVVTHFGDYKYQLPFLSAMWLGGLASGNKTMAKIAGDGAEASIIAAGMITPLLVYISGRALPSSQEPALRFHLFTPNRFSYPSGHTTEAFAVAAVLDENLRESLGYWHTPFVYGAAAAVGFSRIYDHKHYLSDVILGAGIGWSVGKWVASKPRGGQNVSLLMLPNGLRASWKF